MYIEKIKKQLCRELEDYAEKSKLTMQDLETVHKLTDTVKNLDKIKMLEDDGEYSERTYPRMGGSSYDDDMMYSQARGRRGNVRRDSMGRYSRDGESYDYSTNTMRGGEYSRGDAKDHMMNKIGEMMNDADPNEREILKECMRKIERA